MNFLTRLLQGIAFVPNAVQAVELLFKSKSGTEKCDAALSFIGSALSMTEAVSNREIVDPDRFKTGLSQIVAGTVECFNSSIWSKPKQ